MRLCANTGNILHLVHPLGFELDDKRLRRAGLDYRELAIFREHTDLDRCLATLQPKRLLALTTKASRFYHEIDYRDGDALMFGPETRGLPDELLADIDPAHRLRIPMRPERRSYNLANAVAMVAMEAWRQRGFDGAV